MFHAIGGLTLPTPATSLKHKLLQRLLDVQQDLRAFETLDEVFEPELTDSIKVDVNVFASHWDTVHGFRRLCEIPGRRKETFCTE